MRSSGGIGGILMLLAVSSPSAAMADWGYTHWGMTPEQVAGASGGMVKVLAPAQRTHDGADHWELAAEGTFGEGALRLPVGFTFDMAGGGLKCVMYNATGADSGTLRDALVKRYGKPSATGSVGESDMMSWRTPDRIEMITGKRPVASVVSHCAPNG